MNYLTNEAVLRGAQAVETGDVYALGTPIGRKAGDPKSPSRQGAQHFMARDEGHYEAGKVESASDDYMNWADDVLNTYLHGTTHIDAPGHVWYDGQLYNGFDATTTKGGLDRCGIEHVADHGVVGRGVLIDIARHRGVDHLGRGERIELSELQECLDAEGVELQKRDIPIIRTGWIEAFYDGGVPTELEKLDEPGLTYTDAVAEWFHEMEIPAFGTDTIANEQTNSEETSSRLPLHPALIRDQGILFNEILKLDELANGCAENGTYSFLFVASPLKILGGTGSPVNPTAIT
ncbi:cyclase family protein [Salinigranum rubrum]|uniref:cyclase family protein n=1 Tax=Salinigranum rubrum TaxID=755307 RepID=UPI001FE4ACE5|nr:cyclase family protein [Salinigranum rubrum]